MPEKDFIHVTAAVVRFRYAMEAKMKIRQHHGNRAGWMECPEQRLELRIAEEYDEFIDSYDCGSPDEIMDELTDVANCCMMLWDRINTTEQEKREKEHDEKI